MKFLLILTIGQIINAQQVTESPKRIDGVVAVVGDYLVLDSDIDKMFVELQSQGASIKDITRCQMLGKLLEEKLYAHQAIQDSIVIKDEEVKETFKSVEFTGFEIISYSNLNLFLTLTHQLFLFSVKRK